MNIEKIILICAAIGIAIGCIAFTITIIAFVVMGVEAIF